MNIAELKNYLLSHKADEMISRIICDENVSAEVERYLSLLDKAEELYGDGDYHFISSPGRTEIGGNHTDHQRGNVVCAGLNIDNLAAVKPNNSNICNFLDPKFGMCTIDISDLSPVESEKNTSASLIRGIAAYFKNHGYNYGGFDAYCESRVLAGSGISSSACFEVMVVEIFNALFNEQTIQPIERAIIAQYAENEYFGKPCGLMDQMAISVGGFVFIDFFNPENPTVENSDFSFEKEGYRLVLVNTRGDHADLSDEYAAIPVEIRKVAAYFGKEVLAEVDEKVFYAHLADVRKAVNNDRALVRSIHFFEENNRAIKEKQAIKEGRTDDLLNLMKKSGASSFMYLQNVYPSSRPHSQAISLGLALSKKVLNGRGAYRVHGGGFEGTILAIVPMDLVDDYCKTLDGFFGAESCMVLSVRSFGTATVV